MSQTTMRRYHCRACGGTYASDGVSYRHACPPVPNESRQLDPHSVGYDPRTHVRAPQARDENVAVVYAPDEEGMMQPRAVDIVAAGQGRIVL